MYRLKDIMVQLAQKSFVLRCRSDQNGKTYQYSVDTDEKQGSECVHVISLLKKVFGKHLKTVHKFADTANGFIKLLSL